MAYGTVKVDNITFDNGGSDQNVTVSGLYNSLTNDVSVTGTISGSVVIGSTSVSGTTVLGTTVTGTTANFTSGNFTSISGGTHTITSGVFATGNATNPSISFTSDPNTGIFSPGADQVAISTNGTERVEFGTSEVVFNNGGADVDFRVEGDTNANLFKIDAGLDQVQVANLNGGPLAGMRNAIINGNFDIWQRGTSFTGAEYGVDRWVNSRNGSTCTMSRQAFTLGQTDVPGEPTYFCRMTVGSVAGASNAVRLQQNIESVRTLAGQQLTISFWAKADAGKNIAIDLAQSFGTGGSPSAFVTGIGAVKKALTTSWQKVTHTVTTPSISSKTLGSDGNDSLVLSIWLDAGSDLDARTDSLGQQSGTFDIAQVQLEPGPVATPFERRPIGTELALCQRYYQQDPSAVTGLRFSGNVTNGVVYTANSLFKVNMRTVPVVVLGDTFVVSFNSATATLTIEPRGFRVSYTANTTNAGVFQNSYTADAEL